MPGVDQEEQVANTLVTKWRVDEDSVEETHRAVKTAEERLQQVRDEMETIGNTKYAAFQDMKKEAERLHFEQIEELLRNHWSERLAQVQGNAVEELRIHEQLNADIERLQQQRQMAEESDDRERVARGGAPKGAVAGGGIDMSSAMGSIGWGAIAGMGGFAGLAAIMADSTAQLRDAQSKARGVGEAAGRDAEFAYGLSPTFQRLSRRLGMDRGQLGRVAGELVPIAPGGEAGGEQIGELTEFAMSAGQATGVDPQTITRLMTQFNILEGVALPNLTARFAETIQQARDMNMPANMFIQTLSQLVEKGRVYNVSMDESTNLIRFFGREIQEGTISMQQLASLQNVGAAAPLGMQALVAERVMGQGGALAAQFSRVGAEDPYFGAKAVQGILRGSMLTEEGKFITPEEGSADEKLLREQQQQLRDVMMNVVKEMGAATGQTGPFAERQMMRNFMDMAGVTSPDMNQAAADQAMDVALGVGQVSKGALPNIPGAGRVTAEGLMEQGQESIRESISMLTKFKGALGEVADSLNLQRQLISALARGDVKEAERVREQLGQMGGENTAGMGFIEEIGGLQSLLGLLPGGGAYLGSKAGMTLSIVLGDKAQHHVDVEVHEENPSGNTHVSPSKN